MSRIASCFILAATAAAVLSVTACDDGEIAVGRSEQQLKKRKDGTPTGDGRTCSWDDSVSYDAATGKETRTPAPNGPYSVGDEFKSPDGCNDCSCTADGITCTERACGGSTPVGCSLEAMQCPDGTYVGRTGPNCEFAPCEPKACTEEAKQCPDGSYVARTGPNCEFAPCP